MVGDATRVLSARSQLSLDFVTRGLPFCCLQDLHRCIHFQLSSDNQHSDDEMQKSGRRRGCDLVGSDAPLRQVTFITALNMSAVLNIKSMANVTETTPGFEEERLAYERARRQKHSPDHLTPLEVFVLRQVVNDRCIEEHTLRSGIGRTSLSRALSSLAKRNLVKSMIDSRDRRKRVLFSTGPGERRLAELDAAHTQAAPQIPQAPEAGPAANELSSAAANVNSDPPPAKSATRRRTGGRRGRRGRPQPEDSSHQQFLDFDVPDDTPPDPNLTPSANENTPLASDTGAEDTTTSHSQPEQ